MSYTPHVLCHQRHSSAEISGKEGEIGETGKCLTSTSLHPSSEVKSMAGGQSPQAGPGLLTSAQVQDTFSLLSRTQSCALTKKDLSSTALTPFTRTHVRVRSKSLDALNTIISFHNSGARPKSACFYFRVECHQTLFHGVKKFFSHLHPELIPTPMPQPLQHLVWISKRKREHEFKSVLKKKNNNPNNAPPHK